MHPTANSVAFIRKTMLLLRFGAAGDAGRYRAMSRATDVWDDQPKTMSFKSQIQQNARVISQLHQRIHETFAHRDDNEQCRELWKDACSEFHNKYDGLAFPGGTSNIRERLRAGDEEAIEYALDFIEVRPYFFRSGYMYNDFMRVLRNCPLSDAQRKRYDQLKARYDDYRRQRTVQGIENAR